MKRAALTIALLLLWVPAFAADITFEWNPVEGAEWYRLHMIDPSGADSVVADMVMKQSATYTPVTTKIGRHVFYVTAGNAWGESSPSNQVEAWIGKPAAPEGLKLTISFGVAQ